VVAVSLVFALGSSLETLCMFLHTEDLQQSRNELLIQE